MSLIIFYNGTYNAFIGSSGIHHHVIRDEEDIEQIFEFNHNLLDQIKSAIFQYAKQHNIDLVDENKDDELYLTEISLYGMSIVKDIERHSHIFYHLSEVKPEVILKTGLKTSSAVHRNYRYSYNNSVFLFSEELAEKYAKKYNDSSADILASDFSRYHRTRRSNFIRV